MNFVQHLISFFFLALLLIVLMWLFYVWIDLFDTRPTLLQSAYQKSVGIRPRVLRPTWPGGAPLYPRTLRGPLSAYWYQR